VEKTDVRSLFSGVLASLVGPRTEHTEYTEFRMAHGGNEKKRCCINVNFPPAYCKLQTANCQLLTSLSPLLRAISSVYSVCSVRGPTSEASTQELVN